MEVDRRARPALESDRPKGDVVPASAIVPGYRLDRYELLCPIAQGGMATVWIARLRGKHGFEKLVAIKMILPSFAQDDQFQRMFLDEAGIASRIEHANVAQILDLGEEHGVLYLAMEWVDGDALSKLQRAVERKGGLIPPGIALRLMADACGGLHAAHELRRRDGETMGVVHRDVSPQNILVSTRGVAKVIDFGIAKARDRVAEDTNAGMLKGKIRYMAPEQALGKPLDARADVWAVGAMLYQLLSGKLPFDGENEIATLHLVTSGRPPLPLPLTVHSAVSGVVRRALTHSVDNRFASAAEMQAAIESAMVEAKLVTSSSDVAAFMREHMADRAKKRKETLDLALSAAAQRAKVTEVLRKAGEDSASGVSSKSGTGQLGGTDPGYATVMQGSTSDLRAAIGRAAMTPSGVRPPQETSSATLGSAAVVSPVPSAPRKRPRYLPWMAAAGLLIFGIVAVFMRQTKPPPHATAATPPIAVSTPTAAPEPTPAASSAPLPTSISATTSATTSTSTSRTSTSTSHTKPLPLKPDASTAAKHHRVDDGF